MLSMMNRMNIHDNRHGYDEIPQHPLERLEPMRKNKMLRQRTFEKWPKESGIKPEELCDDGFYYMGMSDKVQCVYCGGVLSGWSKDDNVHMEHARHFGRCPSLNEHNSNQIGSDVLDWAGSDVLDWAGNDMGHDVEADGVSVESDVLDRGGPISSGHRGYEFGHQNNDMPIADSTKKVYNPKFPNFSRYDQRLKSFEDWPADHEIKKEQLANAGLYYKGQGDKCQCYMCGGILNEWEPGDKPEVEHKKWFKDCELSKA